MKLTTLVTGSNPELNFDIYSMLVRRSTVSKDNTLLFIPPEGSRGFSGLDAALLASLLHLILINMVTMFS